MLDNNTSLRLNRDDYAYFDAHLMGIETAEQSSEYRDTLRGDLGNGNSYTLPAPDSDTL